MLKGVSVSGSVQEQARGKAAGSTSRSAADASTADDVGLVAPSLLQVQ